MNIKFRQGSEELSQKLIDRAQIKIAKLSRFITEGNYEAHVYVDVERESGSQKSDALWRSTVTIDMAGDRFLATETGSTAEKAVDLSIKELKRELRRSNKKRTDIIRKSALALKRLRRGVGQESGI